MILGLIIAGGHSSLGDESRAVAACRGSDILLLMDVNGSFQGRQVGSGLSWVSIAVIYAEDYPFQCVESQQF